MSEAETLFAQCRTGWRLLRQEERKLIDVLARKPRLTQTDLDALKDIAVKAHARIGADTFAY